MADELTILNEAVALTKPTERAAYLSAACGDDAALRARVEALLAAHDRAGSFLEQPPAEFLAGDHAAAADAPGGTVGPYRLLEQIGEGGMGVVFMAEQTRPVRRKVALKIIKPGMDTRRVIARFEAERQALAMMDHPHIAKVLDAGATQAGRPYFVMELVRGVPITEYCDRERLPPRRRLELFVAVCAAVQHAHTKGVIHRDLKPNNVLVTLADDGVTPVPKVIDFGIAKATAAADGPLTDRTLFTEFRQLVGTPLYMSPEQAADIATDVDTRSDVYSLGVLLYELLTGTTPFDRDRLATAAYDEVRRIIREEDPPTPSTRLSTLETLPSVSALRGIEPKRFGHLVRGELDWIVMRAMEKDRTRRYGTAERLARDIQCHLADQAVEACPPTRVYRLRKFARRNKAALVAATAFATVIIAAVGIYVGGVRAEQSKTLAALLEAESQRAEAEARRREAEAANEVAEAVTDFLTERVLARASPDHLPDKSVRDTIVRVMLDPAAASVAKDFKDKPLAEAAVRASLALSYHAIGDVAAGLPHARGALDDRRRLLGPDHPKTLSSINDVAFLLKEQGNLTEAGLLQREGLERCRRVLGGDDVETLEAINNMGVLLNAQGKLREAEPLFREAVELSRRARGDDHPDTILWIHNLGAFLRQQGNVNAAEPLLRDALERSRRVLGDDHRYTLFSINGMVALLVERGRAGEAEPLCREALERRRRVLGDDHPETITSINNLGNVLQRQGKLSEAELLYREALERGRRVSGNDHPTTLSSIGNLAVFLKNYGKLNEAEPLYREALSGRRRVLGDYHPDTLTSISNMAVFLQAQGKLNEAEPLYREALSGRRRMLGDDHPDTLIALGLMGRLLRAQGKATEAEPLCRQALEGSRRVLGNEHRDTLVAIERMAHVAITLGRLHEAEPLLRELYQKGDGLANAKDAAEQASHWGPCLVKLARYDDAEEPLLEALRRLREAGLGQGSHAASVLSALAETCEKTNRAEEAARWRAELAALTPTSLPTTAPAR